LAAEIKGKLGIDSKMEESSGGAFEVFLDGKKIYSKLATGRFPTNEEILKLLKK